MSKRSCLDCRHCHIYSAEADWSEYTPGHPMSWYCSLGKWEVDQYSIDKRTVVEFLAMADGCESFEADE